MKLLKQSPADWAYGMNQQEAMCLRLLLKEFPFTPAATAKISRRESSTAMVEREHLLNESLAAHQNELKLKARKLITAPHFVKEHGGWRLQLNSEEREILLQLLNDIRIGCWRALGEPESIETLPPTESETGVRLHALMQMAGFFEVNLLELEGG